MSVCRKNPWKNSIYLHILWNVPMIFGTPKSISFRLFHEKPSVLGQKRCTPRGASEPLWYRRGHPRGRLRICGWCLKIWPWKQYKNGWFVGQILVRYEKSWTDFGPNMVIKLLVKAEQGGVFSHFVEASLAHCGSWSLGYPAVIDWPFDFYASKWDGDTQWTNEI